MSKNGRPKGDWRTLQVSFNLNDPKQKELYDFIFFHTERYSGGNRSLTFRSIIADAKRNQERPPYAEEILEKLDTVLNGLKSGQVIVTGQDENGKESEPKRIEFGERGLFG